MSRVRLLTLLAALLVAAPAAAHERTVSYSTWEIALPRIRVTVRLTALDVSRLPWAAAAGPDFNTRLGLYLSERLGARSDGAPCPVSRAPQRLTAAPDQIVFDWELTCPSGATLQLRSDVLREEAPSHLHFARLRFPDGAGLEHVLSEGAETWTVNASGGPPPLADSFLAIVSLGIGHILTGYDHLVFLLGLILLGGRLGDVVRIVTGFTIAHSLTLALAVFGVARPPSGAIEALIGLSIALVATENLWLAGGRRRAVRWAVVLALVALAGLAADGRGAVPALTLLGLALFAGCYFALLAAVDRPAPLRAAVAFVFGLVHGFGFAGVLLEAQLPSERLAATLFGFNLGVEIGQVACVVLLWPVLQYAWRIGDGRWQRPIIEYASTAILVVGVFLFVQRAYG
ncbi:MAG TPA: HupE/UreJ family protein [Candidatus Dormibacteraeota bacterium]|nr:HupE/UreJ family protein [Candidatus Dormibacteraeota bacterium]